MILNKIYFRELIAPHACVCEPPLKLNISEGQEWFAVGCEKQFEGLFFLLIFITIMMIDEQIGLLWMFSNGQVHCMAIIKGESFIQSFDLERILELKVSYMIQLPKYSFFESFVFPKIKTILNGY